MDILSITKKELQKVRTISDCKKIIQEVNKYRAEHDPKDERGDVRDQCGRVLIRVYARMNDINPAHSTHTITRPRRSVKKPRPERLSGISFL